MIIMLSKPATHQDIALASEEYKNYIKITIDIKKRKIAIGGEYHADSEQKLLAEGSLQEDIWGGGFDLVTKQFETNAMVNIRPQTNPSPEILNSAIRETFITIANEYVQI